MSIRPVRLLVSAAMAAFIVAPVSAQLTSPMPQVTAEYETWYLNNSSINVGGVIYYPSGPVSHFNRNEMVFTGLFERIPIFKRTTQEPGSVVYVPLAGGLVRPYERRRSGELAGTVGSTVPSFPVTIPAQEVTQTVNVAAYYTVPTAVLPRPVGTTGFLYGTPQQEPVPVSDESVVPVPVATTGVTPLSSPVFPLRTGPAKIETVRRPAGVNGVFVEHGGKRWFADGPAVRFDAAAFTRIADYEGFPVFEASAQKDTIYVSVLPGDPAMLAPYRAR